MRQLRVAEHDRISLGATTLKEVWEDYIKALRAEGRHNTAKDAEGHFSRLVYEVSIGKLPIDRLRATNVTNWLNEQIEDEEDADDEDIRRSKDSANRNLATKSRIESRPPASPRCHRCGMGDGAVISEGGRAPP